ncbi:MAG: type II secretion system GspH family protein [Bacteroidales bacterium]|nr:type II secretion system GspH family protein [Clostridium sp.]MCM1202601.1 type II secretion system GspH family protein [Bacteroidales bacterium]
MKKTNKGFSMVELIIVIAIMAILAGALAPALIKYINKSRISTDIQTANTIATSIQTALADEAGYDAANNATGASVDDIFDKTGDDFEKAFTTACGGSNPPKTKASKCMKKTQMSTGAFKYDLDKETSEITIYSNDGKHVLYPTASECLTNDNAADCDG